jgi:nucleotide-binding universal stress UspA family protein
MYSKIIVGLDGSPRQPDVLARAIELAKAMKADLVLCRAVSIPRDVPPAMWAFQGDELGEFLVEHGSKEIARIRDALDPGLFARTEVRVGQPADVLCSVASDLQGDLVVIGSHGYGGLDRVLGTTAAKVANRAPCSVLVVRATESG